MAAAGRAGTRGPEPRRPLARPRPARPGGAGLPAPAQRRAAGTSPADDSGAADVAAVANFAATANVADIANVTDTANVANVATIADITAIAAVALGAAAAGARRAAVAGGRADAGRPAGPGHSRSPAAGSGLDGAPFLEQAKRWAKVLSAFFTAQVLTQFLGLLAGLVLVRTMPVHEFACTRWRSRW